jgi:hypothetical protein
MVSEWTGKIIHKMERGKEHNEINAEDSMGKGFKMHGSREDAA